MTAATKTPLTLVQCLVKILLGEQIPADNLNGHNEHFYKPLHVIWQQGSAPAVKRAILAQNNPKLKEALAEAEAIIAGNTSAKTSENGFGQKSNATPAGSLRAQRSLRRLLQPMSCEMCCMPVILAGCSAQENLPRKS